ncbi:nucleotidyltransferase family protein [Cellulomonas timonensis]|uniref:nucleotidyltransferase family protein n=1 Tax=Cellulomonas timonensis TaxID=1689271 RepID=UPI00131D33C1|nr:nucleotidyltransferase domain-containing protein [Cellulomonas timonensis]
MNRSGVSRVRPSEALAAHRAEVLAAIAHHGGADAQVFGSVARGSDTVDSDLDLIVTFPRGFDLVDLLDLTDHLQQITGVRVHIISGRIEGPIVERARREAVALYSPARTCRDP